MFDKLKEIVGEDNFSRSGEELEVYSRDSSFFHEVPICVVRPENSEQVIRIVSLASQEKVPIIPRGAGTNPCGEVVGRALILDLSRMDRIIEINTRDMYAIVEPGIVRDNLNKKLKKFNLFFPPDPASSRVATIGGMVSNNSSGLHAVMYGTTKNYVLSLEAILPTGEVIETGSLALKSASGYDLKRLFIGSEGTLGIFTKITLRLLPIPETSKTMTFGLNSLKDLGAIQREVLSLYPAAFEFMDDICLKVISKRYGVDRGNRMALLVVEFSGSKTLVEQRKKELFALLKKEVKIPDIWEIRRGLVPLLTTYGDKRPIAITEDIGVPLSKVPEAIERVKEIYGAAGYEVAVYGHLGDGNLHQRVFGETTSELMKTADEIYSYVLSIDGTISSEHGVGRLRTKYMEQAHGNALPLMKNIKRTIDEEGILNPGCLLD
jgi:glycolate oxidase subunit GlcD